MNQKNKLNITLLIISGIISFLLITSGRYAQETYNLKIGQLAPKTLYSPREMENKVATKNKKEHIAKSIEPQYKKDESIEEETIKEIELFFNYIKAVKKDEVKQYNVNPIETLKDSSPVSLYTEQYELLLGLSNNDLDKIKSSLIDIVKETYNKGITEHTHSKVMQDIEDMLENGQLNPSYNKVSYDILYQIIKPNMTIEQELTDQLIKETVDKIEPVIILEGEKIIEQGTRISEESYELLKDAGYIEKEVSKNFRKYIGIFIIVGIIILLFYFYMWQNKNKFILTNKEKTLLFVLYTIGIIIVRIFSSAPFVFIPITIVPMLVSILINSEIAIILNTILVIVGALIYKADISYIVYFTVTGIIGSIGVVNIRQRNKTLSISAYLGLASAFLIYGIRLFTQGVAGVMLFKEVVVAFLIGILMLVMVVGSLPLWEILFDIVTPIKLLELTNPNQELLKRLLLEATGTYHHSLLVANLAETAANDIGANSLLARVGGYYHDIGKLGYVNYYGENQLSDNPHDELAPELSGQIILSHVSRGEELAKQYKLPKCVIDIILQHHGDTFVQYFYIKAKKSYPEENINIEDFQYKGPKPQTKEAALVMLADVVEATVRSMVPLSQDQSLEKIVDKIVRDKLKDGQLDESNLLIRDIDKIVNAFTRILVGMYHDRIKYPSKEEVGAK